MKDIPHTLAVSQNSEILYRETDTHREMPGQTEQSGMDNHALKLLLENSSIGLWQYSTATHYLKVNRQWLVLTGLQNEPFGGRLTDWDRLVHPADLAELQVERRKILQGEKSAFQAEFRIKSDNQHWLWVLAEAHRSGTTVSGTLLNIDSRKRSELHTLQHNSELLQDLKERNEKNSFTGHEGQFQYLHTDRIHTLSDRLLLTISKAGIGVWEWDIDNDRLSWDPMMYAIHGLTSTDLTSPLSYNDWEQNIHPDELGTTRQAIHDAINHNKQLDTKFHIQWPDGSMHLIKVNGLIQHNQENRPVYMTGLAFDITDQNLLAHELLKAQKAADAANRAKSTFLANISHELRTSLQAILGFSQLMLLDTSLTKQQLNNLNTINTSGIHLHELINDVLEISQIESGGTEVNPIMFDLHRLIDEIDEQFKLQLAHKKITLHMSISNIVPRYIKADAKKLRQVLVNLLSNAIKFTDEGYVKLNVELKDKSNLLFAIEDTGPGINQNELQSLFQPFKQGVAGLMKGGSGLGLVISHEYINLLGGELSVKSIPHSGSQFSFTLPFTIANQPVSVESKQLSSVSRLKPKCLPKLALIADTDPSNATFLEQLLQKLGFQTTSTTEPSQVLNHINNTQPDIILVNLNISVTTGLDTIQNIRNLRVAKNTPIIAISANTFEYSEKQVMQHGANSLLIKPCKLEDITGILLKLPNLEFTGGIDISLPDTPQPQPASRWNIGKLPDQLMDKLRTATEDGDIFQIRNCIQTIQKSDPDLAARIDSLAENFTYDQLLKFLT